MKLTGNKDVDRKILNNLEDKDLVKFCLVDKKANTLCNDQNQTNQHDSVNNIYFHQVSLLITLLFYYIMRYCILLSSLTEIKKIKILKRGDKNT